MLLQLTVENLAVIEHARGDFGPGLNAITGETGAGKSVLLAALALALGGRSDPGMLRTGCDRARVQAAFGDVPPPAVASLASVGIDDIEVVVLGRELAAGGRSVCRVNGALVPASLVREVAEPLLEVHGQGASSRWLREPEQRLGLDGFAGGEVSELRARVNALFDRRAALMVELDRLGALSAAEDREVEAARLDLQELTAAALVAGEDSRLLAERERLLHSARLRAAAEALHLAVSGGGSPESTLELARAVQGALPVLGIDEELDQVVHQAEEVVALLQEMSLQLASYLEHLPDDAFRLAEVEERLALLERMARRHGGSLDAAIRQRDEAARLLAERGGAQDALQRLAAELETVEADLSAACCELSLARKEAAHQLEETVTRDLRLMLMPHATFRIRVWHRADAAGIPGPDGERVECGRDGFDRISFELAPNTGDRLRPLGESASGGEVSRVALALLAHLSGRSGVGTVVFDEIDQGLGGEAANRVGELLLQVARERQVICVTHLAPIAARAATHLLVAKVDEGGGARSSLSVLSGSDRVAEVARLLAGDATPTTARTHARELLAAVGAPVGES